MWAEVTVGKIIIASGVAVVEPSEGAEEESEGDKQEDERGSLSFPSVFYVDEREGDGEEVEESGAKGVG